MNLLELHTKTLEWSKARGILANGNLSTQTLKLVSEFGELSASLKSATSIKDDVGDMLVLITNIASIAKVDITGCFNLQPVTTNRFLVLDIAIILGDLSENVIKNKSLTDSLSDLIFALSRLVVTYDTNLRECWEVAYDDIKDRTGYLNEHGNFIKDEV